MPSYLSPGVYVEEVPSAIHPIAGVSTSTAGFIGYVPDEFLLGRPADPSGESSFSPVGAVDSTTGVGEVVLCTSFADYVRAFGDFGETNTSQWTLAHAVYGFFNNGGSRCFVVRTNADLDAENVGHALEKLEAVDEIAIVAAPGVSDAAILGELAAHCSQATKDRFAIFDAPPDVAPNDLLRDDRITNLGHSAYSALYYPWIQVADPASPKSAPQAVPLSGHIAGIYARVDALRGVHKAPANEVVLGATGLAQLVSKNQQDGLNPVGVNCIRNLNGNLRVWGARTWGGDANGEYKYVNVRRLMIYLEESIEEGTQWVVFEPNTAALWAKITRNVTAFLTNVWRAGALFGNTPQEAFYVRCDASTNPPSLRDLGQVITEIGVAPVRPAEFVIFRVSQWAGPGGS